VGLPEDESIKATGSGAEPETGLPVKLTTGAPEPQPVTDGMTASDTIIRKKRTARKDLTWIGSESITIKKQLLIRSNSLLFKEIHVRDKKRFYFIFGYPPVTRDRSDILFSRRGHLLNHTFPNISGLYKKGIINYKTGSGL
jgi:hypothetical protein